MCRWLTYFGDPIPIEWFVLQPTHSLLDQSMHARMGATTTNGDGFGLGWYGMGEHPGLYRSVHPAWNDRNLRELATQISSPLFFAHIRASTGTAVQETNCHPFRYGSWLFMHNGLVREFPRVKRDLLLEVEPTLLPLIEGSSDSELLFYLALTFGLQQEPVAALEQLVGFVEAIGKQHDIEYPLQMAAAVSDGTRIVAVRYSSEGKSRSLFYSDNIDAVKSRFPDDQRIQSLSDETRLVVSEPLGDVPEVWKEVPESSVVIVQPGQDELRPFKFRQLR
ncbi:MAG TPA: class II glutamine amidotransferase [Coleofasciculaceae cyanobacterium]